MTVQWPLYAKLIGGVKYTVLGLYGHQMVQTHWYHATVRMTESSDVFPLTGTCDVINHKSSEASLGLSARRRVRTMGGYFDPVTNILICRPTQLRIFYLRTATRFGLNRPSLGHQYDI
jgi:hypothetical protein